MKYVCFGYFDEEAWAAMSESEQQGLWTNASHTTMYFARTASQS
jgi:hypothetical protein